LRWPESAWRAYKTWSALVGRSKASAEPPCLQRRVKAGLRLVERVSVVAGEVPLDLRGRPGAAVVARGASSCCLQLPHEARGGGVAARFPGACPARSG
jgi:hypothetical protein